MKARSAVAAAVATLVAPLALSAGPDAAATPSYGFAHPSAIAAAHGHLHVSTGLLINHFA